MINPLAVRAVLLCLALATAGPVWAEGQPYTYVTFPLGVPWALYFMFLMLVLIPFAVMILLAWRHWFRNGEETADRLTQKGAASPQER